MSCKHIWDDTIGFGVHCIKCGRRRQRKRFCANCMGENTKGGFVENWDGRCPDCGRKIRRM